MVQFAVKVPLKTNRALCACVGPAVGVAVNPAGTVNTTLAFVRETVVTPPNIASIATKSGLRAPVDHVPGKSPVFGTIKARVRVVGSVISYPPSNAWRRRQRRWLHRSPRLRSVFLPVLFGVSLLDQLVVVCLP